MTPNAGGSSSDAALVYNEAPWVRKRVVGRGNFGKARLLENVDTGELVVSKEAKLEGSEEARRKQSSDWSKEVELHSQLVHPHIIGYRGSFQKNDMFCIVMDYAAGGTLDGRIAQQREAGEPFCSEMILRWIAEMASALEHMHSHRVLHRDMKPANVLLSAEGEIKLADFGVSRLLGSQTSLAQTVLGTPFYMSPELFKGEPYSQPTDVWALGVVLFELLTLQRWQLCSPSPPPSPPAPPRDSDTHTLALIFARACDPHLHPRPHPPRPFTGENLGVVMLRISQCKFDRSALAACSHPEELKLLVSGEGSHPSLLHPDPEAPQRGTECPSALARCCPRRPGRRPPLRTAARLLGATLSTREETPSPSPPPRSSPFPAAWMPAGGCAGALVPGPSSACPSSACPGFRSHRRLTSQLTLPGAVHPRTASRGGDGAEGILRGATNSGEAISDRPGRGGVCPARERPGSSAGRGRPGSAAGGGGGAGGLAGGVPGLTLT